MKKTGLVFYVMAGLVLLFSSCDPEQAPVEDSKVTVLAALENDRVWNAGDEVVINGVKYTVEEGGQSVVNIEGVAKAESYHAAYDTGNGSVNGVMRTV